MDYLCRVQLMQNMHPDYYSCVAYTLSCILRSTFSNPDITISSVKKNHESIDRAL